MKKLTFILLFIAGFNLFGQEEKYQSGVIVLTDGRIIAMRGDYERVGSEVLFLDDRGDRVSLPTKLVDFIATDEQNKKIRDRSKDKNAIVDDGSLYSKVMRDKENRRLENLKKGNKSTSSSNLSSTGQRPGSTKPTIEIPKSSSGSLDLDPSEMQQMAEDMVEDIQEQLPVSMGVLLTLLSILALFWLISFITEIYLLFTSYQDSTMWGLAITFFTLGSFFVPILIAALLGASGNPVLAGVLNIVFFLGRIVTIMLYIVTVFPGNRLRLFLFWSMPLWFGLITGVVLAIMMAL